MFYKYNPNKLINSLLVFFIVFCSGPFFAQNNQTKTIKNSFVIHAKLPPEKIKFYSSSIEAADFEQFRLKTHTVTLKFKNGFLLELFSAKDLLIRKIQPKINLNNYSDYAASNNYSYPLFEVTNSGLITAEVQTSKTK
jgi:hypothetical protein